MKYIIYAGHIMQVMVLRAGVVTQYGQEYCNARIYDSVEEAYYGHLISLAEICRDHNDPDTDTCHQLDRWTKNRASFIANFIPYQEQP